MNEAVIVRKARYDGRSKKRQWEERRTDKGAAFDVKKSKQEGTEDDKPFERIKRRKFALLLGYSGQNYFGMQRLVIISKFICHNYIFHIPYVAYFIHHMYVF